VNAVSLSGLRDSVATTVADMLALIRRDFPFVRTSESEGAEFVAARLDELPDDADGEREAWLALLPTTLEVVACDDPTAEQEFLKLFLFDGRPPIVVFFTERHEDESDDLLDRFRASLRPVEPDVWLFDDPRPIGRARKPGLRRL